ncbi:MAG: hypothetical protein IKO44_00315 [Ruminococcus sp.]|nr:hypothetical protein [Ruminococcus sp.]
MKTEDKEILPGEEPVRRKKRPRPDADSERPVKKSTGNAKKKKKRPADKSAVKASPDMRSELAAPRRKKKAFDGAKAIDKSEKQKKKKEEPERHVKTEKPLMPLWFRKVEKPLLPLLSGKNRRLKKVKENESSENVTPIWTGSDSEQQSVTDEDIRQLEQELAEKSAEAADDKDRKKKKKNKAEFEIELKSKKTDSSETPAEEKPREPELTPEEKKAKKLAKKAEKARIKAEKAAAKAAEKETVDMMTFEQRRARRRSMRRLKKLLIVLLIAAIAAAIYYTRGLWMPKLEGILDKHHDTIVNDGTVVAGNFPIDLGDSTTAAMAIFDDDLICVDVGHITTYNANGKLDKTDYHSYGTPVARSAGKRMLIFDNGAKSFRLINKSGDVYEKKTENIIIYGAIAENGSVAIVTMDDKYTSMLTVYDKNGTQIYLWSSGDRIRDVSFSGEGEACLVSTFSVSQGRMTSRISRLDLTGSDEVYTSRELSGCVIMAQENTGGRIWAACEDRMYLLTDVCTYIGEYEFDSQLVSMDMCEDIACAAFKDNEHEKTAVCIFSPESNSAAPEKLVTAEGRIKRVRCFDSMAFVLSAAKLDCYMEDGSLAATSDLVDEYSDFVYSDDAVFLLGKREINKIIFKT